MKVNKAIRHVHSEGEAKYQRLYLDVRDQLKPLVEAEGWFFTMRVKKLHSFALKMETGRVPDPQKLEDFLACTIVVPTLDAIVNAESLLLSNYDLIRRRPVIDEVTHKRSSEFVFDDLRLYVGKRNQLSNFNADLDGLIFEVQIKTILQYAWGIATHDLIYKTDTVSWTKERIAYQIKAMLEHAELAIAEAENMSSSREFIKQDRYTFEILAIIKIIEEFWDRDALPEDRKRLAENIISVIKIADLNSEKFAELIIEEKARYGIVPENLSPYAFVVQALANSAKINFQAKFNRSNIKAKLVVHGEMDLPDWMKNSHERIINLGGSSE